MISFSPIGEMVDVKMEVHMPPSNGRHYPLQYGSGCGGHHGVPGGGHTGPPNYPYGAGSESSSSSEFRRRHIHDWHTQQHDQFEKCMIGINNSLKTKKDTKMHKIMLIENICRLFRQAFIHYCELHQVWEPPSITALIYYKYLK